MKMTLSADVKAALKTLRRLPVEIKKERKRILRKAAKPLIAAAQQKAPIMRSKRRVTVTLKGGEKVTYYPGNLRLSIKSIEFRKSAAVFVGPKVTKRRQSGDEYGKSRGKVDAFYAAMIEYGTRKMPAQPFMRPAYESTKGAVTAIVQAEVEKLATAFGRKNEV